MLDTILPSRKNPQHRAQRKAIEQEHSFENLKSMGLKAGVLAIMAGLAFYPKISAEAEVVERETRMKRERRDGFRREERREERDVRDGGRRDGYGGRRGVDGYGGERREVDGYGYGGGRGERISRDDRGGYMERESGRERDDYRNGERGSDRRRDDRRVMRVDEYDARRGEGYRERDRAREQGSARSSGSSRTQQWVEGGYEYLNVNDYQERDRRRW